MFRISTALINKCLKNRNCNFLYKLNYNRNVGLNYACSHFINVVQNRSFSVHGSDVTNNVKTTVEILNDAYKKHSRVYAHSIRALLEQSDEDLVKSNCGLLLLQCCGTLLIDQTAESRQSISDRVWNKLKELNTLDVSHYNAYIQVCIENHFYLNQKDFLRSMKCEANQDTYKLLLRNTCEFGNTDEALELLSIMKEKRFIMDEYTFTSLALTRAINGGLNEVMPLLKTMQTANIATSSEISNTILRGLVLYNNKDDFLKGVQKFTMHIKEADLIKLLMVLGQTDHQSWLDNVMGVIGPLKISKQDMEEFNLMCIRLIHLGKIDAAMLYYKRFVDPSDVAEPEGNYAFFLLVEMLLSDVPTTRILQEINSLKEESLNLAALEKLTFVALKKGLFNVAWELLMNMSNLRPHYFWPFLLHSYREEGEIGVLNMLEKMIELKIKPDTDTLEYYCLHLCDTSDLKQLIIKLKNLGLSHRDIATPLLAFLLNRDRVEAASNICQLFKSEVSSDRLLKPLIKMWVSNKNAPSTAQILKRICSDSYDYTGQFLIKAFRQCKSSEDNKHYLNLAQAIAKVNLNISQTAADVIINRLNQYKDSVNFNKIVRVINNLSLKSIASNNILHPRQMNATQLENHLVELESKEMEIRGVLRLLITEYCRLGNYERAFELRAKFLSKKYEESSGMKTAIMHAYVLNDNVEEALKIYTAIKTHNPNFTIDEFKIIDLAAALVQKRQLKEAINILKDEAKIRKIQGGSQLVRNCWKLIASGDDEAEVNKLFEVLVEEGYCEPANVVLGPLVKIHLNKGDLKKAVSVFKECTEKYNCTPLQLELLSAIVKNENLELLQETLNYCSNVHGKEATVIPAIAAFAQNGLHKPLRKFLLEMETINKREIERRCERWVTENMLFPLETLAQASHTLPPNILDTDIIYHSIMKLHSINNNCEAAVLLYRHLLETEKKVSKKTSDELLRLIQRCKYKVPPELCQ